MKSGIFLTGCLALIFISIHNISSAQNFISVGPQISNSVSKYFPVNGRRGVGASVEYIRSISKLGGVRLNIGYDRFKQRYPQNASRDSLNALEASGFTTNTLIPIRVGYQHFINKKATFLYGEVGTSFLKRASRYNLNFPDNLFSYALGLGQQFHITSREVVLLSITYNYNRLNKYSSAKYFTLRAAYGLKFGKKNRFD